MRLNWPDFLVVAANERPVTSGLSADVRSLLLSLLRDAVVVFDWPDMSDAERDAADALIALAQRQIMTNVLVGTIQYAVLQTTPDGWIKCDGQTLSMADWPELMAVYPNILKNYPSPGLFLVPDHRGRVVVGDGVDTQGFNWQFLSTGGARTHTLTINEIPAHTHGESIAVPAVINGGLEAPASAATPSTGTTGSAGGGAAHNNMPPYGVLRAYLVGR